MDTEDGKMNYRDDVIALADQLNMAVDDDWPDIMDEGCAEISDDHGIHIDTVRLDVEAAL